jgi:YYY domain-containing protein
MQFFIWYILISVIGLAVFPITRRIFSKGVAQGYFFSRIIALFLWGVVYWFLGALHVLPNSLSGALFVLLAIILVSFLLSKKSFKEEYVEPLKTHLSAVITAEVLFFLAFLFMAVLKSQYPNLDHTEKPMEMAFINAILRSDSFPPRDPWLSGYAISYYYFGYIIVSMLIRITGVAPAVGFTLALSLWYGLAAVVIYGIVYQLLHDWRKRKGTEKEAIKWSDRKGSVFALLAPVFALFSGNFEGLLETLYQRGLFWKTLPDGTQTSAFWNWLELSDLSSAPFSTADFTLTRSGWWWWQGSRVLQDYDIGRYSKEIIDEFPFFSFYLGDMHPHVLAIPFVLTAVAVCYMLFLRLQEIKPTEDLLADAKLFFNISENLWFTIFSLIYIGGISFLNTWDFPIYFGLFLLVVIIWRIQNLGWSSNRIWEFLFCGIICGLFSLVMYIPFFASFASQAGGLLPSLVYFTKGRHLWIFFGGLFIPVLIWLIRLVWNHSNLGHFVQGLVISLGVFLSGLGISIGLAYLAFSMTIMQSEESLFARFGQQILNSQGNGGSRDILIESLLRRFESPGGWITLVLFFALIFSLVVKRHPEDQKRGISFTTESSFVVLLITIALALIAFPELFYLQDYFGWRMNTIFKFYYQAWLLLSIAAAYAVIVVLAESKKALKVTASIIISIVMILILIYPGVGTFRRLVDDHNADASLDGMYHLRTYSPDEAEAIDWLRSAPDGVVLEAVGGSYNASFGKVSTHSGLPTVLGWPGHEGQWRGGYVEVGSREEDVREIYQLRNWEDTKVLLDLYQVRYIYVGSVEQSTYDVNFPKFDAHLPVVFQNNSVIIYEYMPEYELNY